MTILSYPCSHFLLPRQGSSLMKLTEPVGAKVPDVDTRIHSHWVLMGGHSELYILKKDQS